ncbi:MAG: signal peptidase II [Chloroflexota bacterium]|nr:signal peptidase II [Chloroflexota bacterium]
MTDEAPPLTSSGRANARPSLAGAVPGRRRWPLFVALAATVVVADQVSKALVTGSLTPGQSVDVIGETVRIVFGQNSGALFRLFKDNAAMFGLVSIVVVGLIVVYHARAAGTLYLTVTLGLLLGGAIGNMIDRLRLGYVVDFVDIGLGSLRFYTFNVADSAISLAILLLFIAAIRPSLVDGPARPSPASTPIDPASSADDDDWPDDDGADDERDDPEAPR